MTTTAASKTTVSPSHVSLSALVRGERIAAPCFSKPACPRCINRHLDGSSVLCQDCAAHLTCTARNVHIPTVDPGLSSSAKRRTARRDYPCFSSPACKTCIDLHQGGWTHLCRKCQASLTCERRDVHDPVLGKQYWGQAQLVKRRSGDKVWYEADITHLHGQVEEPDVAPAKTDNPSEDDWSDVQPRLDGLFLTDPNKKQLNGLPSRTERGCLGQKCEIKDLPTGERYRDAMERLAILACLKKKGVTDKYLDPMTIQVVSGGGWASSPDEIDGEDLYGRAQRAQRDHLPQEWPMPLNLAVSRSDGKWLNALNPEFAAWVDATAERDASVWRLLSEGHLTAFDKAVVDERLRNAVVQRQQMERDCRALRRCIPLTRPVLEIVSKPYLACDRDYVRTLRKRLMTDDDKASSCVEAAFFWAADPYERPVTLADVAERVGITGTRRADKALRALRRGVWAMKVWAEKGGRVAGIERIPAAKPRFDFKLECSETRSVEDDRLYHESWDYGWEDTSQEADDARDARDLEALLAIPEQVHHLPRERDLVQIIETIRAQTPDFVPVPPKVDLRKDRSKGSADEVYEAVCRLCAVKGESVRRKEIEAEVDVSSATVGRVLREDKRITSPSYGLFQPAAVPLHYDLSHST